MTLFDLFRGKPKLCSSCGGESRGLHIVYSGLRFGEVTDRLCHECLVSRLGQHLAGKSIVFFEPLTADGYTFQPLSEFGAESLVTKRSSLLLDSLGSTCSFCASAPRHVWIPQDDLDAEAMERQAPTEYFSIPNEPAGCPGALRLCNQRVLEHLREYCEAHRFFFLTFRFPDSSVRGCYS